MKLPYLLLADADAERRHTFIRIFEKHVVYANVFAVDNGEAVISFLSGCGWKDLPSLIVLNNQMPDMTVPDILREILTDPRYLNIPKIVCTQATEKEEIEECSMLGVKHFLTSPVDIFEFESAVRKIDGLLRIELDFQ